MAAGLSRCTPAVATCTRATPTVPRRTRLHAAAPRLSFLGHGAHHPASPLQLARGPSPTERAAAAVRRRQSANG
jgi:hypothetical protein